MILIPLLLNLFQRFGLKSDFIHYDPANWPFREVFQSACNFFADLNVTNDAAERGVALTQEYLGRVKSESNLQSLLVAAQATRRKRKMYEKCFAQEQINVQNFHKTIFFYFCSVFLCVTINEMYVKRIIKGTIGLLYFVFFLL